MFVLVAANSTYRHYILDNIGLTTKMLYSFVYDGALLKYAVEYSSDCIYIFLNF